MSEAPDPPPSNGTIDLAEPANGGNSLAQPQADVGSGRRQARPRPRVSSSHVFAGYMVAAVTVLIILRAQVAAFEFISIGWIIILVFLPLLPWLLPRLGEFFKMISPYVQSFKLGSIQLDLRAVSSAPISVPTTGIFASLPNDVDVLSASTTINQLITSLRKFRREGGSPVGIIDFRDGQKWRLPNLYGLTRLLELDPVVSELVFTEIRSGVDGYLVGTSSPRELRRQIEQAVPSYSAAGAALDFPGGLDLTDMQQAQDFGAAYQNFLQALGPSAGQESDLVHGYVTAGRMTLLTGLMSRAAIEDPGWKLTEQELRTTLEAPHRYIPTTTGGRIASLIDRDAVALTVARTALIRG